MKKRLISLALALVLMLSLSGPAFAAPTDEKTLRHTVARVYVGDMFSTDEVFYESEWIPVGAGTGFFIGNEGENPQYLITNQHVIDYYLYYDEGQRAYAVDNAGNITGYARAQIRVYFDKDDYAEAFVVEVGDPKNVDYRDENLRHPKDFAILRLAEPTDKRAALPISVPSQAVSDPNKKVITVGFPGVADNEIFKSVSITGEADSHITTGIVNKIFTETGTGVQILEFDAKINHGNSGGPLVFDNGAAIAVTTWTVDDLCYGVGMETIKPYLDRNNVPYTLIGLDSTSPKDEGAQKPEAQDVPDEPVKPQPQHNPTTNWLLYGILCAAILGVAVVLIVLLRKPKPTVKKDGPHTQTGNDIHIAPPSNPQRVLVGVEGPLAGKRFTIEKGKAVYVGRDKNKCKVLFPDKTPGVSNLHCKISFDGKTATITDLKSSYGTAVDGKQLTPNTPTTLHRGLSIDIGSKSNRFTLQ